MNDHDIKLMAANRIIDTDFGEQPSGAMAVYAIVMAAVIALGLIGWFLGPVVAGWVR